MRSITNILLITAILLLMPALSYSADTSLKASPADSTAGFIPGTDKPKARRCGKDNMYQYNEYTIYTVPTGSQIGESVFVYHNDKKERRPCKTTSQKPLYIFDNWSYGGANFFAGVSGDYLFIDQGTGPTYRGLSIYDLNDGKLIFFTNYTDPTLSNGTLTYFETITSREYRKQKLKCPERREWKRAGLNAVYQREMTYDIVKDEKKALDNYRCIAGQ